MKYFNSLKLLRLKHISGVVLLFASVLLGQNCAPQHMESLVSSSSQSSLDSPSFLAAKTILEGKCISCHSASGSASYAPFDLSTAQLFVARGLVVAGKPDESKLLFRLKKSWDTAHVANPSVQNMPPVGELSESEYSVLKSWILSMVDVSVGPYTCNDKVSADKKLMATAPKRLSSTQYRNSLNDFLRLLLPATSATAILNKSFTGIVFPDVSLDEKYPRKNNNFDEEYLKIYFQVADVMAKDLVTSTYYASFITNVINLDKGMCTTLNTSALSVVCQTQLVRNLGLRLARRPLKEIAGENEVVLLVDEFSRFSAQADAVSAILFRLFMSSNFIYMMEDNETVFADNSNLLRLSSYAIASRLSYQFWNTMPDENLLALAKNKDLYLEVNFMEALNYVLSHDNAKSFIDEFSAGWLSLNKIPAFNSTEPTMSLPQINLRAVNYNAALRQEMIKEIQELVSYTWKSDGRPQDILTSNISFARNADLMKIYNLSTPAPANITATNAVRMPASHAGLLTRAGLLAEANGFQSPVHRAIRVMRDVMCLDLPSAPADTAPEMPLSAVAIETMTMRQQVTHNTSTPTCFGCHKSINPFGFALSNFNGLGFYQDKEPAMNALGQPTGTLLDINSQVSFDTTFGPTVKAMNAVDYSQMLSQRNEFKSCFVGNYSEYFLNRQPDATVDGCRLNRAYLKLENGQSMGEVFKSLALDPEFRMRKLENK